MLRIDLCTNCILLQLHVQVMWYQMRWENIINVELTVMCNEIVIAYAIVLFWQLPGH